jgi:hypothetical protein
MNTNYNIKTIVKYGLIIITILSLGRMCSKNINDESLQTQEVWGYNSNGEEVQGKVQKILGDWKGVIRDSKENKYTIIKMQLNLDSSYYAYDTNGDLFTLHIK